jgi:hypothetical protein
MHILPRSYAASFEDPILTSIRALPVSQVCLSSCFVTQRVKIRRRFRLVTEVIKFTPSSVTIGQLVQKLKGELRIGGHKRADLHTPWSRVLLEKLAGSQLVKKFRAFCRTRRFITAIKNARHLSLF